MMDDAPRPCRNGSLLTALLSFLLTLDDDRAQVTTGLCIWPLSREHAHLALTVWPLTPFPSLFPCLRCLTLAFPKLSDFVVYPLQGLAGRVEDKKWALSGGEGGSSVQCWSLKWEKWGQVENNKLSHLSRSPVSVLGLTLHAGTLHRQ